MGDLLGSVSHLFDDKRFTKDTTFVADVDNVVLTWDNLINHRPHQDWAIRYSPSQTVQIVQANVGQAMNPFVQRITHTDPEIWECDLFSSLKKSTTVTDESQGELIPLAETVSSIGPVPHSQVDRIRVLPGENESEQPFDTNQLYFAIRVANKPRPDKKGGYDTARAYHLAELSLFNSLGDAFESTGQTGGEITFRPLTSNTDILVAALKTETFKTCTEYARNDDLNSNAQRNIMGTVQYPTVSKAAIIAWINRDPNPTCTVEQIDKDILKITDPTVEPPEARRIQ